jgi:hypothetical protein
MYVPSDQASLTIFIYAHRGSGCGQQFRNHQKASEMSKAESALS